MNSKQANYSWLLSLLSLGIPYSDTVKVNSNPDSKLYMRTYKNGSLYHQVYVNVSDVQTENVSLAPGCYRITKGEGVIHIEGSNLIINLPPHTAAIIESMTANTAATQYTSPTLVFGWNGISFPGRPVDPRPAAVSWPLDLTCYSLQYWLNNEQSGWKWNGSELIRTGRSYWVDFTVVPNPSSFTYTGYLPYATETIAFPKVSAAPHWVAFGHPQDHATPCANITFHSPSSGTIYWPETSFQIVESIALGFDSATQQFFTAGPPATSPNRTVLEPWYTYWLLVNTTEEVTMSIP